MTRLEARFRVRVCTVMFSGERAIAAARLCANPSTVSPGRPAIRSMLMFWCPAARLAVAAQDVGRGVPAADARQHRVAEGLGVDGDAGAPYSLQHSQLFRVGTVGRPASTVYSSRPERSKHSPHGAHQLAQLRGPARAVGVPPPM